MGQIYRIVTVQQFSNFYLEFERFHRVVARARILADDEQSPTRLRTAFNLKLNRREIVNTRFNAQRAIFGVN